MRYIYLVRSGGLLSPGAVPVAGFTDRSALVEWLRGWTAESRALMTVWRMEDGGTGAAVELGMNEFVNDNQEEGT